MAVRRRDDPGLSAVVVAVLADPDRHRELIETLRPGVRLQEGVVLVLRPPALSVRGCVLDLAGDPIGGLVVCILDATAIFGWHTVEEFVDGREPELKNSMKIRVVVTSQSVDPLANVKVVRGLETFRTPSFGSFRPRGKAITDAQPAFALSCPVADVELHVAGGCVVGLTQPREVARTLVVLRGDEEVARRPDDLGQVEVDVVR